MKKYALAMVIILMFPGWSHAGIGACHDGAGKIVKFEANANPDYYKNTLRCVYFEVHKDGITQQAYDELSDLVKNYPVKYVKWGLSGRPELKTAQESSVADAEEQQAVDNSIRAQIDELDVSVKDVIAALIKRINARLPAGQAITKQEIIDQIKQDRGL